MFCCECGKEISQKAIACPGCGCATTGPSAAAITNGVAPAVIVLGYVCSVLFCPVGLVLGITTMVKGNESQKVHGIVATVISVVVWIISAIAMLSS